MRQRHRGRHEPNQLGNFEKKKPRDGIWLAISVAVIVTSIFVLTALLAGA